MEDWSVRGTTSLNESFWVGGFCPNGPSCCSNKVSKWGRVKIFTYDPLYLHFRVGSCDN